MKIILITITILISSLFYAQSSDLEIYVKNIKSNKGDIILGLYNNKKDFTKKIYKNQVIKAKKGEVKAVFKNLPYGTYAIAILHDENSNGKMDFNLLGIPKEDYGFSNNAKGVLSAPSFKKASFKINKNQNLVQVIDL